MSGALPVRSVPCRGDSVRAFCDGLLPERPVRERPAGRVGLSNSNTFGLLEAFGRACVGALSLVPKAQALSSTATSSVEGVDQAKLTARVESLASFPLADSLEANIRISLADAQEGPGPGTSPSAATTRGCQVVGTAQPRLAIAPTATDPAGPRGLPQV
ncbi:MAG: HipA N-terminal domain-containing protein [Candidatus Dormibacteria bacterium]